MSRLVISKDGIDKGVLLVSLLEYAKPHDSIAKRYLLYVSLIFNYSAGSLKDCLDDAINSIRISLLKKTLVAQTFRID